MMKKLIALAALSLTFAACSKSETEEQLLSSSCVHDDSSDTASTIANRLYSLVFFISAQVIVILK